MASAENAGWCSHPVDAFVRERKRKDPVAHTHTQIKGSCWDRVVKIANKSNGPYNITKIKPQGKKVGFC